MKRPEVKLDNYEAVYDFYREHQQNKAAAKLAYLALNKIFTPRVSFANGAEEQLRDIVESDTSLIIATNHLTYKDQYTVAAAASQTPLREDIGRTRVLAKDELFHGAKRPFIDMMGAAPVFRSKNHDPVLTRKAGEYMTDAMARRLLAGDNIAIFPEGTCNLEDPSTLLPLHMGLGHMAVRAQELGANIAVLPIAFSYGDKLRGAKDTDVRNANVYVNSPIIEIPTTALNITESVHTGLQEAVDKVNE